MLRKSDAAKLRVTCLYRLRQAVQFFQKIVFVMIHIPFYVNLVSV